MHAQSWTRQALVASFCLILTPAFAQSPKVLDALDGSEGTIFEISAQDSRGDSSNSDAMPTLLVQNSQRYAIMMHKRISGEGDKMLELARHSSSSAAAVDDETSTRAARHTTSSEAALLTTTRLNPKHQAEAAASKTQAVVAEQTSIAAAVTPASRRAAATRATQAFTTSRIAAASSSSIVVAIQSSVSSALPTASAISSREQLQSYGIFDSRNKYHKGFIACLIVAGIALVLLVIAITKYIMHLPRFADPQDYQEGYQDKWASTMDKGESHQSCESDTTLPTYAAADSYTQEDMPPNTFGRRAAVLDASPRPDWHRQSSSHLRVPEPQSPSALPYYSAPRSKQYSMATRSNSELAPAPPLDATHWSPGQIVNSSTAFARPARTYTPPTARMMASQTERRSSATSESHRFDDVVDRADLGPVYGVQDQQTYHHRAQSSIGLGRSPGEHTMRRGFVRPVSDAYGRY
ncbi:uncharacterized protein L969DRAFT_47414 [Mixia osmundae IAM 14324]|uniref:Mid2 domain-containing protein n=1 Tax=Mixia osmundae (strain CBS 9802 / IAM 14324 / JCM 22182 / KY 12970) TaxID=764103 RepID=G7E6I2_MIXOS|nr:uncharacterized protein L969DRAFT_47414 [Mixia osmundae IAM 14324]KEI40401.1 hypothetical protein L969DRAFT_47414 [Mixia osmundae IAM 14324]GAA98442.1 hypothetical protein E5Q_05128 [Mixia osmundae IAM 14324]